MNPDEMDDEQTLRAICIAIAAVSGISCTAKGLMDTADQVKLYIENGGFE